MRKFWDFKAAEGEPKTGELALYGVIEESSWFGDEVTPKQFRDDLAALGDITELKVFISSPGGDAFAGQAIYSMLARHPAHVTVYVDGLAASAASFIVMAGDKVIMPKNAMLMIHNPWTIAMGDAREFRKVSDELDHIREAMVPVYSGKSGIDRLEIIRLLNAETWMTAQEAVDLGFADEIEPAKQVAASVVRPGVLAVKGQEFDLGRYHNAPDFAERLRDAGAAAPSRRQVEQALRDVGYSQSEAKAILAKKAGPSRDVPPVEEEPVTAGRDRTATERLRSESDRIRSRIQREYGGNGQ